MVIAACRRPDLLQRCLAAICAQRYDPHAFEIVVVDAAHSAATQGAVEISTRLPNAPSLRCVRPRQGHGAAAARNAGWRAAYGRLVAFIDEAAIPEPDWLANGERALTADLVALCGKVALPVDATDACSTGAAGITRSADGVIESITTNAFVRRSALFAVGGFDERFEDATPEDADLQWRLLRDAGPVGHSDAALVRQPPRPDNWHATLRRQRTAYFDALLFKKHRQACRDRALATPPWDYYAIVALIGGALVLWLLDIGGSAVVSLLIGLAMVARLAWRRLPRVLPSLERVVEISVTSALIPFLAVYWRLRGAIHFRVPFL